jgi:CDP-glycerol glycerophosphotransferase
MLAEHQVLLTEDDCKDHTVLLLAADVLVTQHHAALFEYSLVDRPIVLVGCLCPVRPSRGSRAEAYIDLDGQAPGPVVWTADELRTQLHDLDALQRDYREARARWTATYAAYDDGNASAAVADYVMARLG